MSYYISPTLEFLLSLKSIPFNHEVKECLGKDGTLLAVLIWGTVKTLNDKGQNEISINEFNRLFNSTSGTVTRAKKLLISKGLLIQKETSQSTPAQYEAKEPKKKKPKPRKSYIPTKLNPKVLERVGESACKLWHIIKDEKDKTKLSTEELASRLEVANYEAMSNIKTKLVKAGLLKILERGGGKGRVSIMEIIEP